MRAPLGRVQIVRKTHLLVSVGEPKPKFKIRRNFLVEKLVKPKCRNVFWERVARNLLAVKVKLDVRGRGELREPGLNKPRRCREIGQFEKGDVGHERNRCGHRRHGLNVADLRLLDDLKPVFKTLFESLLLDRVVEIDVELGAHDVRQRDTDACVCKKKHCQKRRLRQIASCAETYRFSRPLGGCH